MTQTVHIMLDLETWGTDPGRDIRSIGACVFDPETGRVQQRDRDYPSDYDLTRDRALFDPIDDNPTFYQNVTNTTREFVGHVDGTGQRRKYPLTRDPSTVEWWSHPDRAAAAAQLETDAVDLRVGLERFTSWLVNMVPAPMSEREDMSRFRIWCHGANMDEPMLRHAFKTLSLPVPWHYRSPRDTRTAFDMAGMDPATCLEAFQTGGTHHNALDDAITQSRAVCHAYQAVRGWREAWQREDDADPLET